MDFEPLNHGAWQPSILCLQDNTSTKLSIDRHYCQTIAVHSKIIQACIWHELEFIICIVRIYISNDCVDRCLGFLYSFLGATQMFIRFCLDWDHIFWSENNMQSTLFSSFFDVVSLYWMFCTFWYRYHYLVSTYDHTGKHIGLPLPMYLWCTGINFCGFLLFWMKS